MSVAKLESFIEPVSRSAGRIGGFYFFVFLSLISIFVIILISMYLVI